MRIVRPTDAANFDLTASNVPEVAPAAYNAGTTYAADDLVSVFTGTTALVYKSRVGSNTGNTPASSPTQWLYLATTYAEYAGGTSYSLGDVVIDATAHHEYESLANANLGNALTDATKWLDLGFNNRWRMFDQSNTSLTNNGDSITITADITGRADSVAVLNVVASQIQIIATTLVEGEVYNRTFEMVSDSGVTNWYDYFFEAIIRRGDLIVTDLPIYADMTITVILGDPGGTANVGTLVIGQGRDLGATVYGARVGIQDYSRKVADDFGNYTIVERPFSKRASFKVVVDSAKVDAISALLAVYRATPVVYAGADEYGSTFIYGFYKTFDLEIAYLEKSTLTLDIEGLT